MRLFRPMKLHVPLLGILLLFAGCSKARNPEIAGYWLGELTVRGITLKLGVDITKAADGKYSATFDSLDQGARDIPVSLVTYSEGKLHLGLPGLNATFDGTAGTQGKQIEGTWNQMGLSTSLVWKRGSKPENVAASDSNEQFAPRAGSDIQGIWKGTLAVGAVRLRIVFKLAESKDGQVSGVLDSLDQGARNIPLTTVTFTKPTLNIEVKPIGGTFDGKLTADGKEVVGEWEQLGRTTPLTLTRADPAELATSADQKGFARGTDAEPQGVWFGTLSVRGTKLRLVMKVARNEKGELSGTMDSLDQGVRDLPASQVSFTNGLMHMEWQGINATFEGDLADGKLDGEWRQAGANFPLVLQRTNAPSASAAK